MLRRLVGHRGDHDDAAVVRRVDRLLRLRRVADGAERFLDDVGAAVEREEHAGRESRAVADERVRDPHRQEATPRARANVAGAVRGRGRVLRLPGAVSVLGHVERIVVAVEEVPARDVVDVAVRVVVDAVRDGRVEDQVLGIGEAVRVAICERSEVGDVEAAVAVAVAGRRIARRTGLPEVHEGLRRQVVHGTRVAAT